MPDGTTQPAAPVIAPSPPQPQDDPPLDVLAETLLAFAAEHGLLNGATAKDSDELKAELVDPLVAAIDAYRRDAQGKGTAETAELLYRYGRLIGLTKGVTGRSVIDSGRAKPAFRWMGIATIVVLLSVMAMKLFHSAQPAFCTASWLDWCRFNAGLAWGALGSAIFLMKTLSDRIGAFQFDARLVQGTWTRILFGAILGAVVPSLFDLGATGGEIHVAATAFLCGLGAKLVYGAIEALVATLVDRFGLGGPRAPA
ncbi:MAG: hypothetical protein HQL39_04835 [Alphaproteobacteria bacterium]|nr:hypothetical protein [Alphaproteobacteria bacterium]